MCSVEGIPVIPASASMPVESLERLIDKKILDRELVLLRRKQQQLEADNRTVGRIFACGFAVILVGLVLWLGSL